MEKRKLGRINFSPTIITLGGCGPGYVNQEEADKAVKLVMKFGVNMLDIAPSYGEAEIRLRPWIEKYRNKFFIAEKTTMRTKEGAWKELKQSLENTQAKYFDNYQFHAVGNTEELNEILGPGGAMEAFKEAKETGLIHNIGITGHANIEVFIEALDRFDFDTVLAPINFASMTAVHPHNDFRPLLDLATERDVGIIAIKSILKRRWTHEKRGYNTWYEPVDDKEIIEKAIKFTLSQRGVTSYALPCDIRLWEPILEVAEKFEQLDQEEMDKIVAFGRAEGFEPLFPVED